MINESADLFEPRSSRRQAPVQDDLIAELGERLARLVERHRATQRAVGELREAVAARDRRIVELDAKLALAERGREELVARIDALLADVDELLEAADAQPAAEPRER